jgi:hypothetical protein
MARSLLLLTLVCAGAGAFAQEPPPPPEGKPSPPEPHREGRPAGKMREWYNKLPDSERAKFSENFQRWEGMDDKEKRHFRERFMSDRKKVQTAIDEALKKSGLQLDSDQKEVFALRYLQERRKIEKELREEMEKLRNQRLEGVVEKLKAEFQSQSEKQEPPAEKAEAAATPQF